MEQQASEAKEGVAGQEAPQGASPASVETRQEQSGSPSVNGAAQGQSQEKPESIPFGDKRHPEYKRFRELTESNRRYKDDMSRFQTELAELRGFRDSMISQRQGQGIAPEQEEALEKIFGMAFQSQKVKDMIAKSLGIDKFESMQKDYSSFKEQWEGRQYEDEMKDVLASAKDLGLDPNEVEEELRDYVASDPFFSKKDYYKGGVHAAFRNKYWDKQSELRERADNLKKIKEREALKSGQTQGAASSTTKADAALPKEDGIRRNVEIIRRAGGLEKLHPMFR